jgi:YidC/Oxa1 family membrane protein insertase
VHVKKHPVNEIHVLVAPTWGPNSILNVCGEQLVSILLDAGFYVTLRPHWQTVKLTPEVVDVIQKQHKGNPHFTYEARMSDNTSLLESDVLVCDWSSTSIEYALGLGQPVLYIDVPRRIRNKNYESLGCEPLEVSIREKVGTIIHPDNLHDVPDAIRRLTANPGHTAEDLRCLRDTLLFNFGNAVPVGTDAILALARDNRGIGSSRRPSAS